MQNIRVRHGETHTIHFSTSSDAVSSIIHVTATRGGRIQYSVEPDTFYQSRNRHVAANMEDSSDNCLLHTLKLLAKTFVKLAIPSRLHENSHNIYTHLLNILTTILKSTAAHLVEKLLKIMTEITQEIPGITGMGASIALKGGSKLLAGVDKIKAEEKESEYRVFECRSHVLWLSKKLCLLYGLVDYRRIQPHVSDFLKYYFMVSLCSDTLTLFRMIKGIYIIITPSLRASAFKKWLYSKEFEMCLRASKDMLNMSVNHLTNSIPLYTTFETTPLPPLLANDEDGL
ncbi:hypothetical protein M422DRAFT_47724 [Sphaerobolus stellatus SS14]|uniref:Uncharacterized protein n=1 Tax=Sphaerobolus stellatus (strain SS14) TaxID=990650 RepID=A0A0C9VAD7_SPHS4|nr:hypothetical protein M422DRAFT_47724 [Sphaerobolus stellatus SS14]